MQKRNIDESKFIIDDNHTFIPVICERKKENNHYCNSWLGLLEVSRPNISYHHCQQCNLTYVHYVNEDGLVEYETTDRIVLNTELVAKVRR